MTSIEMVREFRIFVDKVDSQSVPDFEIEEIYIFLNEAQERYIKTHYGLNNIYQKSFEASQKRTDDLSNLVVTRFTAINLVSYEVNTYEAKLDTLYTNEAMDIASTDTYMFFIRGRARHNSVTCGTMYINPFMSEQDDLENAKLDPFKRPDLENSLSYFEHGNIYIITDGTYTIDKYKLTFIRRPLAISASQNCELKAHTHKEIVQLAVQIALENIESPRLGTDTQLLNKTE